MTLETIAAMVSRGGVLVLSGAGLSTESGIPDYRGPSGSTRRRHTPMTYQAFTRDPVARRRYWARSHLGWRAISAARPNAGHRAVAALERKGLVAGVITQNVDGLHSASGSRHVIDLHGRLDRVICLGCGARTSRHHLDTRMHAANRSWRGTALALNPDGDVDIPESDLDSFAVVDCEDCGGVLKPDVVYFGESVPTERVARSYALLESARALLVLGSSLHVFSGRRFVTRAAQARIPIAIINQGPTRGDETATSKVDAPLGRSLIALEEMAGLPSSQHPPHRRDAG